MPEPTSALSFADLILEVARKMGVAYHGVNGDEEAQLPQDAYDLAECKRHVNNAIRMFVNDAPAQGWRWAKPTAQVVVWGTINTSASNTLTSGGLADGVTTLTASADAFYPSMELKTITITGVGSFTIASYVSATQIRVTGDATATSGATWSITADGNYTLPATFSGQYSGQIAYAADTNQGISLDWSSEAIIRKWREDTNVETGDPYWAAVRPMSTNADPRRRWELMLYPSPDEVMTVEFPFILHFDKLVDLTEVPPAPFSHDETVKQACFAVVEKDVEETMGREWDYYHKVCLPQSHRIDGLSAPKKLGYFGNPGSIRPGGIHDFRQNYYDRPNVTFNS